MSKKYKLHDLARDLNVPNQEIISILEKQFEGPKKSMTALTDEEANYVLEAYTQSHQVNSFDEYYRVTAVKPVLEKEPQKGKEPVVDKKELVKEAVKKSTKAVKDALGAKNNKQDDKTSRSNQQKKPLSEKPNKEAKAYRDERKAVATPNQTVNKKPQAVKNDIKDNTKAAVQNKNVPAKVNKPENKQINKDQKYNRFKDNIVNNVTNKPKPKQDHKPQQENNKRQQLITNAPSDNKKVSTRADVVTRTVDTRGSYVELDKYNEKYTNLAESKGRIKDNFTRKQKINQKSAQRHKQQYSKKETEAEKLKRLELERARKQQLKVMIPDEIVVSELAIRLKVTATDVIKKLMKLGEMCTINQTIDFDTAAIVAEEFGAKVEKEVVVTIEERLIDDNDDNDEDLVERSPVVVVMGHVDHGKTSLLDKIRNTSVTSTEAGGITQHIGACRVNYNGKEITFLDTPGHAAFTAMRARGANMTDIAILVVAADDGIMPQTVEAINHAKAAGVTIIVAINKMDKEHADPGRVKQELTEHELLCEEWGGDVICVPVSAHSGLGINELLENILLVAEIKELKANPNRLAKGTVIEAKLDKGRGPIATLLVQNGTLKTGDVLIAGASVGRVRVMTDDKGNVVTEAGPAVPVEITGLAEVPCAGDVFNAVEDEKLARELVEQRKYNAKQEIFAQYQKVTLDNLFSQISEGEMKELPIIVKADVQGSVEAVKQSLEKISNDEVRVRVIHGAVGGISESDVMLANASNAIIVGFNVRPDPVAFETAERDGVDVRLYRIIYDAIEEISTAMKGLLAPKFREVECARIEVRQVYKITNVGTVSGCYVLSGKVARNCQIRVVRENIIVAVDKMASLKRFKDDVKEVASNYECGITLEKFSDIKEGDIFEAFVMEEYRD